MITFRDSQAIAVRNAANEAGCRSMEDYEVISILDSKYLAMVRPPINSYILPEYDMGAIAMRLLTKMLVNDPSVQEDRKIEIEYSPMIRESVRIRKRYPSKPSAESSESGAVKSRSC